MEGDMHELSIAQSVLEAALPEARKYHAKVVCALGVKLGKANHIEPDSLECCFRVVTKGTIAEQATVKIEPLPLMVKWRDCGCTFSAQMTS